MKQKITLELDKEQLTSLIQTYIAELKMSGEDISSSLRSDDIQENLNQFDRLDQAIQRTQEEFSILTVLAIALDELEEAEHNNETSQTGK